MPASRQSPYTLNEGNAQSANRRHKIPTHRREELIFIEYPDILIGWVKKFKSRTRHIHWKPRDLVSRWEVEWRSQGLRLEIFYVRISHGFLGIPKHTLSLNTIAVSMFLSLFETLVVWFLWLASRRIVLRPIHKKFLVRVFLEEVSFNGSMVSRAPWPSSRVDWGDGMGFMTASHEHRRISRHI